MGRVTRTDYVGSITQSHTFEDYADFVKWSMQQDDTVPTSFSEENCSEEQYTLTLNEHEVYTLRLLLGHCLDAECNSVKAKLDEFAAGEFDYDDYNRIYFHFFNEYGDEEELLGGGDDVTIRFKG